MKWSLALLLLIFSTNSLAYQWRWKDLDPFNRNSAVRAGGRRLDPAHALARLHNRILYKVGAAIADNSRFRQKAETDGWTLENCRTTGGSLTTILAGFYSAPICAAMTAGEPLSAGSCIGLVTGSGALITHIACTQLCNDRKLRGC